MNGTNGSYLGDIRAIYKKGGKIYSGYGKGGKTYLPKGLYGAKQRIAESGGQVLNSAFYVFLCALS